MTNFFSEILLACLILGLYFTIQTFRKGDFKYKENRLFAFFCIFSVIWSLGFYGVIIQTNPNVAYNYRAFGMIGTFGYLITAQFIICYFSNINKYIRYFVQAFSLLGIPIYFFVIQKDECSYKLTEIGMTYSFPSSFWNTVYIIYSIIMAFSMLHMLLHMVKRSKTQKLRDLGKKLLAAELVLVIGMLLDTIFPIIGKTAIPGSTIGQFVALAVMYNTMTFVAKSRITINNMSEFIYYSITVPVIVCDPQMNVQIINDVGYSFLGIPNDTNLNDYSINSLFNLKDNNDISNDILSFEGKSTNIEANCINNSFYCNLSINKILDSYNDHIGYIIIVTNLTERMKTMQKLEAAMLEAENANNAKSTFLASMSHEIRTPMNAIIGFSELTLKMDIDDEVRKNVEDIKLASNNLLALINDILDISKIESGKMELVLDNYHTSSLLRDVSLIIEAQASKKDLNFHLNVDEKLPKILYGDRVRLRGILINILNNSVKYTTKGSISLDVAMKKYTFDVATIEFKITDTGIGIPPEKLNNLFNTFERVDPKHHYRVEGSGLGLAIANGYVSLMGGTITVDSIPNSGSVFKVTIEQQIIDSAPIDTDFLNQYNTFNGNKESMHITNTKVLIVDDNLVNLRVASGLLAIYGLSIDTTSSGEEAVSMCQNTHYDMIFLDQMMPGMDGITAMKHIREINSHYAYGGDCKIIVLTADAIKGVREKLIESGFDEYLGKPINLTRLEQLFVEFIPSKNIYYTENDNSKPKIDNTSINDNTVNTSVVNANSINSNAINSDTVNNNLIDANSINDNNNLNLNNINDGSLSNTDIANVNDNDDGISTETITFLTNKLAQVDVAMGITNCGSNINNYLEVLKITYEHGHKQLEELSEFLKQEDYENYIIKIHSLKSTSLSIGAVNISDIAKLSEEKGRGGDTAYLVENFPKFKTYYSDLLKDIESVLIYYKLISSETETYNELNEAMIPTLLSNIERCINSYNFTKIFDILTEIRSYTIPEKYKDMFEKMDTLMEDLLVDELMELIQEFRE